MSCVLPAAGGGGRQSDPEPGERRSAASRFKLRTDRPSGLQGGETQTLSPDSGPGSDTDVED